MYPNGGRQFLSNRRSNPILYHCLGNLTVYVLENSNLSCVDRHLGYMKKLRRVLSVRCMCACSPRHLPYSI
jgi:hypothetical protein